MSKMSYPQSRDFDPSEINFSPPPGYTAPRFPSLYWPFPPSPPPTSENYLYLPSDIWRFTLYWTLLFYGAVFLLCGLWAFAVFGKKGHRYARWAWLLPVVFASIGLVMALVSATIVGFALAAIYNAAYFRMSTWVPLLWASAQILVVVMSSYSTVTTVL